MEYIEINSFNDIPVEGKIKLISSLIFGITIIIGGIPLSIFVGKISSIFFFFAFGLLLIAYTYYRYMRIKKIGFIKADFLIERKDGYREMRFGTIPIVKKSLVDVSFGNPKLTLLKEVEIDGENYRLRIHVNIPAYQWNKFREGDTIVINYLPDDMKLINEDEYNLLDIYGIKLY